MSETQKVPAGWFITSLALPVVEVTEKMAEALYEAALLRMRANVEPLTTAEWTSLSGPEKAAFAAAGDELRARQAEVTAAAFASLVGAVNVRTTDDPDKGVREALETT